MRAVHLGYPRISPKHFDLVVPTPEYPVPDAPGLGIEVDEAAVQKQSFKFWEAPHWRREGGSHTNW